MHKKLRNYTRTHRRRWGLTQEELAYLLGVSSQAVVSRYELEIQNPTLPIALAYYAVFGEQLHKLFPKLYSEVEEGVMQRAYQLYKTLEGRTDKVSRRKRELLDAVRQRATQKHHDTT